MGDITTDELVGDSGEGLRRLDDANRPHRTAQLQAVLRRKATRIILIDKPVAAQSVISVAELSAERKSPDYYALNVMNAIFGGQFMSRLNMNLRETKGYTYGARSMFEWHVAAPGASWPAPA